jgi:hypothetical protein
MSKEKAQASDEPESAFSLSMPSTPVVAFALAAGAASALYMGRKLWKP